MRYDKDFAYFAPHLDWYEFIDGKGYVPTEKAPTDAADAMKKVNQRNEYYNKREKKLL